jgi:hypothetical protein
MAPDGIYSGRHARTPGEYAPSLRATPTTTLKATPTTTLQTTRTGNSYEPMVRVAGDWMCIEQEKIVDHHTRARLGVEQNGGAVRPPVLRRGAWVGERRTYATRPTPTWMACRKEPVLVTR